MVDNITMNSDFTQLLQNIRQRQPQQATARPETQTPVDTGVSDTLEAKLSVGEYVFDAEDVSKLGAGDTETGFQVLDAIREILDQMDAESANMFGDIIVAHGNMLLDTLPKIEDV